MLRSLAAPISVFPLAPPFSQAFSIPPISIESYQNVFRPCLCFFGRGVTPGPFIEIFVSSCRQLNRPFMRARSESPFGTSPGCFFFLIP